MPHAPTRVVSIKTRAPVTCVAERPPASSVPPDPDAVLDVPCVKDGNFCLCWMPAWFHLAERVGAERQR